MIIRKATKDDIDGVAKVYSDVHSAQEAGLVTCGWNRKIYPTMETAVKSFERDDLFVLSLDGKIIGTAIINKVQLEEYKNVCWNFEAKEDEVMVLHTLAIDPEFGRRGYGKKFVEFYEKYALENNCKCLRIDTNSKNTIARALYKSLGYIETDVVDCVFNGIPGVKLILLEKKL